MEAAKDAVTVSGAIAARQSVRAFLAEPVSGDVVYEILDLARRSPSNGNLQPWQVHAVAGETLHSIGQVVKDRMEKGIMRDDDALTVYPPSLWEPYRSRRHTAGTERYAAMGFYDKDPVGLRTLTEMNVAFFGAPVGLIFGLSNRMERHQWCDLGMFMQSFMLLAVERGLDTCPQAFWTNWHEVLAEVLALPDDFVVVAGMSLGYRDSRHPINQYRTERAPVESFAKLSGF
jgi:nitroreductase